ncbi:unnamed protein product [Ilex paraguariensis]|uniref:Uncharacterized protein n=1 Tax=Ilex paraguariensis TaxID=185542 RepID=A0ABC8QP46_9AQUA
MQLDEPQVSKEHISRLPQGDMDQYSPNGNVAGIPNENVDGDTCMRKDGDTCMIKEEAGVLESLLVGIKERSGEESMRANSEEGNVAFDDDRGLRCVNEPPNKGYHSDMENSSSMEVIEAASPVSETGTCTEAVELLERTAQTGMITRSKSRFLSASHTSQ